MRAEIINCFLSAICDTFKTNSAIILKRKGQIAEDEVTITHLGLVINLFGSSTVKGKIVIKMEDGIAKKVIASMMGNEPKTIDDIGLSALGEYSNWIIGAAANNLKKEGKEIGNFSADIKTADSAEKIIYSQDGSEKYLTG